MDIVATGRALGLAASAVLACAAPGALSTAARAEEAVQGAAMVERPLFSATRRPPPPPMALPPAGLPPMASEPPAPAGPDVALSGVIAGGGGGVALLRRPQDAAPVRLGLGGTLDGWTLSEIRPRAVVLRRDDRAVTIDLPAASR